MKIEPTKEQQDIIKAISDGNSIKISALAGAAKTSSLVMAAEAVPKQILYLTFNKAMADEAKQKFPTWVEVRTTHSLAYGAIGHLYREKLKRPVGKYVNVAGTASEVARFFKVKPIEYTKDKWIVSSAIGQAILSTVGTFECSRDNVLDMKHVSMYAIKTKKIDPIKNEYLIKEYKNIILKHSKALWELRVNLKSQVLAGHDTYLKLYQLSKPNLGKFDIIMLDEAQDTNMCVVDIIRSQIDKQIIVVGDPNQAIYQFRGATNALDKFDYPTYTLSKSFRYGQSIADIGMAITGRKDMKGWEKLTTNIIDNTNVCIDRYTSIYRSNSGMLEDAIKIMASGKTVNIIADMRDFTNLIDSALSLKAGDTKKVKHELLLVHESWKDLEADIDWCSGELQRVVQMIKDGSVYKVLGFIRGHRNTDNPDITFLTAHKSKGLEFDNVVLGDDFPNVYDESGIKDLPIAEINLLYVAATRAKKTLAINQQIKDLLKHNKKSDKQIREINITQYSPYMESPVDKFEKDLKTEIGKIYTDVELRGVDNLMVSDNNCYDINGNEL